MFLSKGVLKVAACAASMLLVTGYAFSDQKKGGDRDDDDIINHLFVPDSANNRVLLYHHPKTNGQNADVVLGQPDFVTTTFSATSSTMSFPGSSTQDLLGKNVYVGDASNCRVLGFKKPFTNGEAATLVIGAPDFTTSCTNIGGVPTASSLGFTGGVALDWKGNLWVADLGNNRVLRFPRPFTNGEAADVVLGQADFVSSNCNGATGTVSQSTLCRPSGIAFDLQGDLWVADSNNNRVLEFRPPFTTDMNASVELGQPAATAFTSNAVNNGGVSASSLDYPTGVGFDLLHKRLWVADRYNNRVLMYDARFRNGMAAELVLGQPDFVSSNVNQGLPAPTAATLDNPDGIVIHLTGDVWVGDTQNNRTLKFSAQCKKNGENASLVLGQPNFTQNAANEGAPASQSSQDQPFSAGPSLIALGVLAGLAGGKQWIARLRRS